MAKTVEWFFNRGYNKNPKVSFVLNTHNMAKQAVLIVRKLRQHPDAEIIVVDDGCDEANSELLRKELTGVNEYVLRCNDLFETITVDRAFRFANGDFAIMLQDDDDFDDLSWVKRGIDCFVKHPGLGILGGREGVMIFDNGGELLDFDVTAYHDCGKDFCFVQTVNAAPIIFDRRLFLELGGFDQAYAPCMWSDHEICLRAWQENIQVGWYDAGFKTFAFENAKRRQTKMGITADMDVINRKLIKKVFGSFLTSIDFKVMLMNQGLG